MIQFDFKTFCTAFSETWVDYKWWIVAAIAGCFLLHIIHLCRIKRMPIRTSSNELGELFVSRGAILHLIRSVGQTFSRGYINRVKIKDKKHSLMVQVHVKIGADQSFDDISIKFQEKIQQLILRYLGVLKTVRVDVILDDVEKSLPKEDEQPEEIENHDA